jgi:hypothetical protein
VVHSVYQTVDCRRALRQVLGLVDLVESYKKWRTCSTRHQPQSAGEVVHSVYQTVDCRRALRQVLGLVDLVESYLKWKTCTTRHQPQSAGESLCTVAGTCFVTGIEVFVCCVDMFKVEDLQYASPATVSR